MSLQKWLQSGLLRSHQATVAEVQNLLGLVDRELSDAKAQGLSADGQFMHAYDAALQLCKIALHASGFEVQKGQGHHAHTINSLQHTLGGQQVDKAYYLSKCSTLRHHGLYDSAGVVNAQDAKELFDTAIQLRADVLTWLRANHPKLLPKGYS